MPDKIRGYSKIDVVKELIWTLLLAIAFFLYWILLLLAVTFVFNSIIYLSFRGILLISVFLTISMVLYHIVNTIRKYTRNYL